MTHLDFEQNTKIVATIGPASSSYDNLLSLAKEGVAVFRLNFSHGSHEDHLAVIERINEINEKYDYNCGILADLQGPKIRIGKIEGETVPIFPGHRIVFTNEEILGNADQVYMSYSKFPQDVQEGDRILLDDGKVVMKVVSSNGEHKVELEVVHGSTLSSRKGVNLPDTNISLPALTEKDLKDLEFILTQPVHWIALSFVRSPNDVKDLRSRIRAANHPAKIISKIEKPSAVQKIDYIIHYSDAIMIARGDLGIEVPIEQLPPIQKTITRKCIAAAKPVIVATQMMDSMIKSPFPTRAEVTDVANAVLDGADAVMLSGETSVGDHPALVVKEMNKIILEAEKRFDFDRRRPMPSKKSGTYYSDVLCSQAAQMSDMVDAKGVLTITGSGYSAMKISSYRPKCKLYVFSDDIHMVRLLRLVWGTHCFHYDRFVSTDETIEDLVQILKEKGVVKIGDVVLNTGAMPVKKRLRTNMLKITIVD